jgi:hypothetical protein
MQVECTSQSHKEGDRIEMTKKDSLDVLLTRKFSGFGCRQGFLEFCTSERFGNPKRREGFKIVGKNSFGGVSHRQDSCLVVCPSISWNFKCVEVFSVNWSKNFCLDYFLFVCFQPRCTCPITQTTILAQQSLAVHTIS